MTETIQEELHVFELTRSFSAPVDVVYRAFTEAEALGEWGMGKSYKNLALDIDVRPGGVYYNRVLNLESKNEWIFFGVYQVVEPNELLSYTFDWKTDWREPPTPSIVEIHFRARGDKTELEIVHSQLPEPALESTETHYIEFLDALEEMLAGKQIS